MYDLLNLAKYAAFEAGVEILKFYENFKIQIKPDNSPLTSADLAANEKIIQILEKSKIPICSEERILEGKFDLFWLVDPLDGTRQFIKKNNQFCVCIALIKNSVPVFGVIFIPNSLELFYGFEGKVFKEILLKDGGVIEKIKLEKIYSSKNAYIYTTNKEKRENFAETINFKNLRIGSAIKFCRLVELGGIYIREENSSLWDIAAGEALIINAKGEMLNFKKERIIYDLSNLKSPKFIALSSEFVNLKDEILAKFGSKFSKI